MSWRTEEIKNLEAIRAETDSARLAQELSNRISGMRSEIRSEAANMLGHLATGETVQRS